MPGVNQGRKLGRIFLAEDTKGKVHWGAASGPRSMDSHKH